MDAEITRQETEGVGDAVRYRTFAGRRPKVLLVDDSPTVTEKLQAVLQQAGFQVVTHREGFGTLVTVARETPDLIMLDITIPGLQGPELCRLIKSAQNSGSAGPAPILLYSSIDENDLRDTAAQCGADGYLHKGWTSDVLIQKITEFVGPATS